jgi:hypothetical protein
MYGHHKNNTIYNNETVQILNHINSFNKDGEYHPETVEIKYSNGKTE